jgi:hypothetical protein
MSEILFKRHKNVLIIYNVDILTVMTSWMLELLDQNLLNIFGFCTNELSN